MSKKQPDSQQLNLFAAAIPVRTIAWLESVLDWLGKGAAFGGNFIDLLQSLVRAGWSSKTFPAYVRLSPRLNARRSRYKPKISIRKKKLKDGRVVFRVSGKWTKQATLKPYSHRWPSSATGGLTGALMLNTTDWHSDGSVSSLSDILETPQDWLERHPGQTLDDYQEYLRKFYLSPKACSGILRRAEKRGRELPEQLRQALAQVALMDRTQGEET